MECTKAVRGLRITWTVFWGLACVLLVVLWVRSYWWEDLCQYNFGSYAVGAASIGGVVQIAAGPAEPWMPLGWVRESGFKTGAVIRPEFDVTLSRGIDEVNLPHWLLAMLCAVTAIVSLSWRFSLSTLLIATTVVALLLGAFAWIKT